MLSLGIVFEAGGRVREGLAQKPLKSENTKFFVFVLYVFGRCTPWERQTGRADRQSRQARSQPGPGARRSWPVAQAPLGPELVGWL